MVNINQQIVEILSSIFPKDINETRGWFTIKCPFHEDTNPSCGIYVAESNLRKLGSYHCFSCGASGTWEELTEKLGISTELQPYQAVPKIEFNIKKQDVTLRSIIEEFKCTICTKWNSKDSWRGFDGQFLQKFKCYKIANIKESYILFPLYINSKLRAGIRCTFDDRSVGKYIFTSGSGINEFGIYPFDIIKELNPKYVVLVEGIRDALMCIKHNIPALCIFGATNLNKNKVNLVKSLDCKIYIMSDADQGGDTMWQTAKKHIPNSKRIKLPDKEDPCSVGSEFLEKVKIYLDNQE